MQAVTRRCIVTVAAPVIASGFLGCSSVPTDRDAAAARDVTVARNTNPGPRLARPRPTGVPDSVATATATREAVSAQAGSGEPPTGDKPEANEPEANEPEAPVQPSDLWARMRRGFRLGPVPSRYMAEEIARYAGNQTYFDIIARRAQPYLRYIIDRIAARGLPMELALIPMVESAFKPFAYSSAGAAGLWQFKSVTGYRFGLQQNWWYDARRDVLASTDAALDYLEYLHGFFDGNWLLAIAAYNAGEGTVRSAIRFNAARGRPTDFWHLDLPRQTENYLRRLLALRAVIAEPAAHGIALPEMPEDRALAVVELETQIDLARLSELVNIPLETLYRYNPGLNRWATPPMGPYRIAVPRGRFAEVRRVLARHDPDSMLQWRRHAIKRGDTLIEIAAAYDTTVSMLRKANGLTGSTIRAGEYLLVPVASRPDAAYSLSLANRRRRGFANGSSDYERIEYRVQPDDTLWEIAQRYGVDVDRLADWNDMAVSEPIHPGERLTIRVAEGRNGQGGASERLRRVHYTVESGDSLYGIAQRFNVEVAEIRRWNNLGSSNLILPGQEIALRVETTD